MLAPPPLNHQGVFIFLTSKVRKQLAGSALCGSVQFSLFGFCPGRTSQKVIEPAGTFHQRLCPRCPEEPIRALTDVVTSVVGVSIRELPSRVCEHIDTPSSGGAMSEGGATAH